MQLPRRNGIDRWGEPHPSVSVIIPARNRASVIERAVRSAATQTHPPAEIIIVDDFSDDSTLHVARQLAEAHRSVRVVSLDRRSGAPTARNIGARNSTGSFLAFLDSDDEWHPEKLERQLGLARSAPDAVATFTALRRQYANGASDVTKVSRVTTTAELQEANVIGGCSSFLVTAKVFAEVGGFDVALPSCQDWDLWLRLACLGPLLTVDEPLTVYHMDSNERISKNAQAVIDGHRTVFSSIYQDFTDQVQLRRIKRAHEIYLAEILLFSLRDPKRAAIQAVSAAILASGGRDSWRASKVLALAIREAFLARK